MMKFGLSYNTNGLRTLSLLEAIDAVARFGYEGIELSFYPSHFHPLSVSQEELKQIKEHLQKRSIQPICLAVGAANLLSDEPFEPSLIHPTLDGRRRRVDLLRRAIEVAKFLEIPVVNFASGIKKEEITAAQAEEYLSEGIASCLRGTGDIILAIEPEPKMFIETTVQAIDLIGKFNSPNLKLNLDIGHVQCCEDDLYGALARAIPYARHVHVEDIKGRVHHHEIPGEGDLDFSSIMKIFREKGYQHYLSVELYHHAEVWKKALRQSRAHLVKMMK